MNKTAMAGGIIVVLVVIVIAAVLVFNGAGNAAPQGATTTVAPTTYPTTIAATTTVANNSTPANNTAVNATLNATYAVKVGYNTQVGGNYLMNNTGYTLYLYTSDTPYSNVSTCYGECATFWPPFYPVNLSALQPGLNGLYFGHITRTNGALQLTYRGWPLYYYLGDSGPYTVAGQGQGGTWYAVNIPNVTIPG